MMDTQLVTDQMGRQLRLPVSPRRIISLVPSQTEFLIEAGIGDRLIARTQFCIHPENAVKDIPRIGGTKKLQMDNIRSRQPDLLIGNMEENEREQIETLASEFPVWMSDIRSLPDAFQMMQELETLLKLPVPCSAKIASQFTAYEAPKTFAGKKVLYAIWRSPWMFAGTDTFIDTLLRTAGLNNACTKSRYPGLREEEISGLNPDFVFLSSEPYPFGEKHRQEMQMLLPDSRIILTDGEMFSWYGSRLRHFPAYVNRLAEQLSKG